MTSQATPDAVEQAKRDLAARVEAFRDLHGPRLQAFAVLVTVGDVPWASALVRAALVSAALDHDRFQHAERAAALLREHVMRGAMHHRPSNLPAPDAWQRHDALRDMRVSRAAMAGLEALSIRDRAAIVAADLEGLRPLDVGDITGHHDRALWKLLGRARLRFANAFADAWDEGKAPIDGPLISRVRSAAGIPPQ
jgi:DNA-directed RNA polymerase specialized sigma24 family protein